MASPLSVYFARLHGSSVCAKQCKGEIWRISICEDSSEDSNAGYCFLECEVHRPTTLPRLAFFDFRNIFKDVQYDTTCKTNQTKTIRYIVGFVSEQNGNVLDEKFFTISAAWRRGSKDTMITIMSKVEWPSSGLWRVSLLEKWGCRVGWIAVGLGGPVVAG